MSPEILNAYMGGFHFGAGYAPEMDRSNIRFYYWCLEKLEMLSQESWATCLIRIHGNGEQGFYATLDFLIRFQEYNDTEELKNASLYAAGKCEPELSWKSSSRAREQEIEWHIFSVSELMSKILVRTPMYIGTWSLARFDAFTSGWSFGSSDPEGNQADFDSFYRMVLRRYPSDQNTWWKGIEDLHGETNDSIAVVARLFTEFNAAYENNI
ncbi:MAG: hypothetical protein R3C11_04785 [Planctomycetaceae bacterium]